MGTTCRLLLLRFLLSGFISVVLWVPVRAEEKCGGLKMDKQPPVVARVGDWVDIHFTYWCQVGHCPTFNFDMGDGVSSGPTDSSGFLHQYPYPGTYTWSVSVQGPDSCNGYYSGDVQICPGTCPGEELFNTPDTQGGPAENPDTVMEGGDGPGQCQPTGLPNYWINTATLNLVIEDTLFSSAGAGPPVDIKLTFNDNYGRTGFFGKGWRLSYESRIDESCDEVRLTRGSGKQLRYAGDLCPSSGVTYPVEFTPPPGVHERLFWHDDHWVLVEKGTGYSWRYDRVPGRPYALLTSVTDSYGKAIVLAYENDRLTSLTDAAGRISSFDHNSSGRVSQITAPDGRTASLRYDTAGRLTNVIDLAGVVTAYRYFNTNLTRITVGDKVTNFAYTADAAGFQRLSAVRDARGNDTLYLADTARGEVTVTDPEGGVRRYKRTAQGQTLSDSDPLGNTFSRTYDSANNLLTLTDPLGNTTRFEYDSRGNLVAVIDALGHRWEYSYNARDLLTRQTDPLGQSWEYNWNAQARLARIRTPMDRTYNLGYDSAGLLSHITDPLGRVSEFGRDRFGNLTTLKDPLGNAALFTYDENGLRPVSFRDARGNVTAFSWDANDRLVQLTHPDGSVQTSAHDCCAGTSETDENGNTTTLGRDRMLHLTEIASPLGHSTFYEYDRRGNLISSLDPLGRTTGAAYDAANRLVSLTDPAGGVLRFEYDAVGNVVGLVDARGNRTIFAYDAASRLRSSKDPSNHEQLVDRDALGRVSQTTDARGKKVTLAYNAEGKLTRKEFDGDLSAAFRYDTAGNLIRQDDPHGVTVYGYTDRDEVSAVTYPSGLRASFTYDPAGNVASITYPGGFKVDYIYDQRNRPIRASWTGGFVEWSRDPAGNLIRETRSNAAESTYAYDADGRLQTLRHQADGAPFVELGYTLDAAGNTIQEVRSLPVADFQVPAAELFTYNGSDQMTAWSGEPLTYDANGNLTGIGGRFQASYDAENRPVSITRSAQTTTYGYDGLGNRISATRGLWQRNFHHGPEGELLFETDGKGKVTVVYIYLGQVLVARRAGSADTFYHFDSRGSTLALTDTLGEIAAAYAYDPFGRVTHLSGSIYNPFTYVGAYGVLDDGDGLYFMTHRYYEASIQRFLQKDPIGFAGGSNLYAYVEGNPIDRTDPLGLAGWEGMAVMIESAGLAPGSSGAAWLRGGFQAVRNWRGGQVVVKLISKTIIEGPGISRTSAAFKTWILPMLKKSAAGAIAGIKLPTVGMCAAVVSGTLIAWGVTGMVLEDIGEKADLPRVRAVGKSMNKVTMAGIEKVIRIAKDVPYFIRGLGVKLGLE